MLFPENLVVFNVFYVNLGCLSIGWRLIYRLIYRLILNMQNLSAKTFFLLALSFFLFLSITSLTFSLFKYLNVWWWGVYLSCIAWWMDEMFTISITLSITYCLYPSRFLAYLLAKNAFLCTWFGTKMKVFGTKLAFGFKILYLCSNQVTWGCCLYHSCPVFLCGELITQIPQWL